MSTRLDQLPGRLRKMTTFERFSEVPALLVRKDDVPRPFLLWIHGRTANKELDPGRYLRYVRRGINICAVDLPGHGERFVKEMQDPEAAFEVVQQMSAEVDGVISSLDEFTSFDLNHAAIGGMSAGGMATILRLVKPHSFKGAILEATMGQWRTQRRRKMFNRLSDEQFTALNPADHLQDWAEIPILVFHSRHDEWVPYNAQEEFISRLKQKYSDSDQIEFVAFDHTGAPKEHMGFGRQSAFVKEIQVEFLARALRVEMEKAS
ncbi:prolyl oligopeptidase family serine peptidase [PVC group bacterium]|nr:prolyl oligopeptidase family serine peptidase [PVC group bacterium]